MAKLYLKFEQAVLKEFPLTGGSITIGRLPDNAIQIDNLAVSGHHAKVFWETDKYVLEDHNSLNGTYLNNQRVSRVVLKDGDAVLIGKHTLQFKEEGNEKEVAARAPVEKAGPEMQQMEATMVLDTKKAKEMLAQAAKSAGATSGAAAAPAAAPAAPARDRMGILTIMSGKTSEPQYLLSGKITVIGKSDMASIKLKGWFAPNVAAIISKRDMRYYIAAQDKGAKLKVGGQPVTGQKELNEGDMVEVAGLKMTFAYQE